MAAATGGPAQAGELPQGFVFLADIDPTIVQDMRYAGPRNFTRGTVPGYAGGECVLGEPTARALAKAQARMADGGRTLIVYDCYRPARAVRAFVKWAETGGRARDPEYHPRIGRSDLVAQGYIAARSGHSTGGSVDLAFGAPDGDGNVLLANMGGAFDLFDALSHTANTRIPAAAQANRKLLVDVMAASGFANYRREWWHFRHGEEAFPGRHFDFPIPKRGQ